MRALTKCLLITILISACYDDPLAVDAPIEGEVSPEELFSDSQSRNADGDRTVIDHFAKRLAIDVRVENDANPKLPITVTLLGVAVEPITGGTVQVLLPTQAAMQHAGSGERLRYPAGVNLPVTAQWQLPAMQTGETWSKAVRVGNLEKGYYHVVVEADAQGPETARGPLLVDDSYTQAWVFVDESSVRLTAAFDNSVFGRGVRPLPGPFRARGSSSQGAVAASRTGAAYSNGNKFYAEVVYYENRAKVPAVGASVIAHTVEEGDDWDDETGTGTERRTVPSSGIVSLTCPGSGYQVVGTVGLPITSEVGGGTFNGYWDAQSNECGDTIQIEGTRHTYLPWKHLKEVVPLIDGRFDENRSRIDWRVRSSLSGSSQYDPQNDRIVFGSTYYSKWTAGHEYVHAMHEESLGGLWTAEAACYSRTRPVWRATGYKCALQEGIADYGGNVGSPNDPDRRTGGSLETIDDKPTNDADIPAQVEGRVAALFHDLFDSANEGDDATTYDGSYIIQVFRSCEVRNSGSSWRDRDDVSDFVWCLENRVKKSVHKKNFPGITAPDNVREDVTEPTDHDEDDIRATWLQNVGR